MTNNSTIYIHSIPFKIKQSTGRILNEPDFTDFILENELSKKVELPVPRLQQWNLL